VDYNDCLMAYENKDDVIDSDLGVNTPGDIVGVYRLVKIIKLKREIVTKFTEKEIK
jgi:hypothetical protein